MASGIRVVWDPEFTRYDFGPDHPMAPIRLDLTARLADSLGLLSRPDVRVAGAKPASDDLLATVHDAGYVAAVRRVSADPLLADLDHGLGTEDDPAFAGMHDAAARIVTGSVECAEQVWRGDVAHGVNFCGGLHHAMPDRASGFCVYNDVAVGIQWLLDQGVERVAYVDVDVHHGDGVERLFWDDPRVLTISLHETGELLFPGTGASADLGGPEAQGYAVNVPLPPGTSDAGWLRAFHAVVPPLLREFAPQVLVTQHGCDSHAEDPLAHLMLTVDGQRAAIQALHELAHEVAGGRWVAVGGGGYEIVGVVPRTWTHLLAEVAGRPLDPHLDVPGSWLEHVQVRLGRVGPRRMGDGREPTYRDWREGYDPATWLDRSVHATRMAVFPLHGLDPMP
jgi:acetoin utilization protein AcuC